MVASPENPNLKVIGGRPVRPDGTDKVTGRAQYGSDIRLNGMLYGRVVRSPHAHALIKNIDYSKAEALPGVRAVITSQDLPSTGGAIIPTVRGPIPLDWERERLLAADHIYFRGHPIAAICATDPHIAEDALALVEVEYEVLPPVLNIREAMDPNAPILFDPEKVKTITGLFELNDGKPSNVARHLNMDIGDIESGFEKADVIVEREFETASTHQGYIETHNATAFWNHDGKVTIWTSTQGTHNIRQQVAQILQLKLQDIKVVPMEIGGGFGGKLAAYLDPIAALLSKKSGLPVQMTMSRQEVFESTGPTSASLIRVRMGATREGKIIAAEADITLEAGGFPGAPLSGGARCGFAPYDIENHRIRSREVVVNKPRVAAYRAPGTPQAAFAVESVIDEIAEELGIDPLVLRQKNAAHEGTQRSDGGRHTSVGCEEVFQVALESPHYRSELEGENRGRGVSAGFWFNGGNESSAYISVNADGTVNLVMGSVDIGGQRASLAMMCAESLGIPYEHIHPQVVDTDSIGFTAPTAGSRTTFATGWAIHNAALDVQRQLVERAAKIWETDKEKVNYKDGIIHGPDDQSFTFTEIAKILTRSGGSIQGRAHAMPTTIGAACATHIVDVEVDPETGKVEILRYTAIQDVGKAIHPSYVEGQMQGGVVQGIGWALNEEYLYDKNGTMVNSTFLDYRMPTTLDVPMIDTVLVEVPNPGHPYGVRGVGEVPIVPPLAAITNAIYDAVGKRIQQLPASPRVILNAITED